MSATLPGTSGPPGTAPRASTRGTRIRIGLLLLAALVAAALGDRVIGEPVLTTLILLGLVLAGEVEFFALARRRGTVPSAGAALLATVLLFGWRRLRGAPADAAEAALPPLALTLALLFHGLIARVLRPSATLTPPPRDVFADVGVTILGFLYLAVGLGALQDILGGFGGRGVLLTLAVVLTSKANDIGGYLLGSAIGRRKLAPLVSPGKTLEGAAGGAALAVATAFGLFLGLPSLRNVLGAPEILLFAAAVSVLTQLGDLSESLLKRSAGVKDAAALIPTFGGVLDLVDSLTLAAPAALVILLHAAGTP